jgi:hypothetical protein
MRQALLIITFVATILSCQEQNNIQIRPEISEGIAELDNPDEVENLDITDINARMAAAIPGNTCYFQYQNSDDTFKTVYEVTDYIYDHEPTANEINVALNVGAEITGFKSKRLMKAKGPQWIKSKKFSLGWHVMKAEDGEAEKFEVKAGTDRTLIWSNPTGVYTYPNSGIIRIKWQGTPPPAGLYCTYWYQQDGMKWQDFVNLKKFDVLNYFEGSPIKATNQKSVAFRAPRTRKVYVTTTEAYPNIKGFDVDLIVKKSAVVVFKYPAN